jgi:hypothetical protein
MFLSKAISLAVVLATPVWARLNMAQCVAGFDWVRDSESFFLKRGVVTNHSLFKRL